MPRTPPDELSAVFAALADPSRRRILALLRETNELCVGDIAQAFDMSLNGVSKHLKVLEAAGLVQRRIERQKHWLSARWEGLQAPYDYLNAYHDFWSRRLEALVDYLGRDEEDS